ncbi:MAG: hypothetical protein HYT72_03595 [Candidatus Aenigmarchaeota archaeon]|nr:hypothetical protein [Candidatus Aenigmarchaeota archaeon]
MQPKHGIVTGSERRSVLPYVLTGMAGLGLAAYLAVKALTGGGQATVPTYPERPPAAAPATATPAPKYFIENFIETADGLARIEFPGLTEAEAKPYLESAHQQALRENAKFNAVLTPEKQLWRYTDTDERRLELQCPPCDNETMYWIDSKLQEAYNFIADKQGVSRRPKLFITVNNVAKDGDIGRAAIDFYDRPTRRDKDKSFPWHVNKDFGQMVYEMTGAFDDALGYTGEVFLSEFWGMRNSSLWLGGPKKESTMDDLKHYDRAPFEQQAIGVGIYASLYLEGFTEQQITQLAQRLEGKKARWEQFKAEADAVAGRHLSALDRIDYGVKGFREGRKKTSAVINDRSVALAGILEENPGLNTPVYIRTYYEQFA